MRSLAGERAEEEELDQQSSRVSPPPIPFSAITAITAANDEEQNYLKMVASVGLDDCDHHSSNNERSVAEEKLIARGKLLLHAYQTKKKEFLLQSSSSLNYEKDGGSISNFNIFQTNVANYPSWMSSTYDSPSNKNASFQSSPTLNATNKPIQSIICNGDSSINGSAGDSWEGFVGLLQQNEELFRALDGQLTQLWEVVEQDERAKRLVKPLCESITALMEKKYDVVKRIDKMVAEAEPPSTSKSSLRIDALNGTNNGNHHMEKQQQLDEELHELQNQLREKEELLSSLNASIQQVMQERGQFEEELQQSRQVIENLEAELSNLEKAAADKRTLLQRAFMVKARQLDALCADIPLPETWERWTDEHGIVYYRQNDRACGPELEDPRVDIALQLKAPSGTMKRSPSQTSAGSFERNHRSSSTGSSPPRHESVDLTVACEDIHEPPDDGYQHQIDDFTTPLPDGWEMRVTASGAVFFVNRHTKTSTWSDPRKLRRESTEDKRTTDDATGATQKEADDDEPQESAGPQYFDVIFKERGPIGIHFQANNPDCGATVRRLLPGMAAVETEMLQPYDCLVAVNKNPVDTAPFRHVMLLLQGGFRPLTLTFRRDPNAGDGRDLNKASWNEDITTASGHGPREVAVDLDEEVVCDTADDILTSAVRVAGSGARRRPSFEHQRRLNHQQERRQSTTLFSEDEDDDDGIVDGNGSQHRGRQEHEEDLTVADKIITNLFSLFWTPPDTTSAVQTV